MNAAVRLYELAVQCKGRIRSGGWWSPWYVRRLRDDTAELFRLFQALPEPRLPCVDRLIRLVLQALGASFADSVAGRSASHPCSLRCTTFLGRTCRAIILCAYRRRMQLLTPSSGWRRLVSILND